MSKLGFMQDLIRGIKKIVGADEPKTAVVKETVVTAGNAGTAPLLKRAFMFLEDGSFAEADEYCEKVLDIDPECAEAYLGKLMAELQVNKREQLADCDEPFDDNRNYQKIIRFADDSLKKTVNGYILSIKERIELNKKEQEIKKKEQEIKEKEALYYKCKEIFDGKIPDSIYNWTAAKRWFDSLAGWRDSDELSAKCSEHIELLEKDETYQSALRLSDEDTIFSLTNAIDLLEQIPDWKDSTQKIELFRERIEQLKVRKENYDAYLKKYPLAAMKSQTESSLSAAQTEFAVKKKEMPKVSKVLAYVVLTVFVGLILILESISLESSFLLWFSIILTCLLLLGALAEISNMVKHKKCLKGISEKISELENTLEEINKIPPFEE